MVIKLYDIDNKKYLFDVKKPIDRGHTGLVYKIDDDTCLKYTTSYRLHQWYTLSKLMELNLDNFYKIYKILFDSNGDYSGYLMKYYQNELIDILTMPTEYTLDNFYRLSNTVNKISNNEIVMYDLHDGNVIMNKNDIIIIDADFYDEEFEHFKIDGITLKNDGMILRLDKNLIDNKKSNIINVEFKKDGEFTESTLKYLLEDGEILKLETYTFKVLNNAVKEMLDGYIIPKPYKDGSYCPCDKCKYKGLCHYKTEVSGYREITKKQKTDF